MYKVGLEAHYCVVVQTNVTAKQNQYYNDCENKRAQSTLTASGCYCGLFPKTRNHNTSAVD